MTATPFFIVSSGRSGTAMLHKALSAKPNVEMHHEYAVQITQPLAVKRYLGLMGEAQTRGLIGDTFGAAIHHSRARLWGDSSNKLSWLIPDLAALYPDARFVHLVRDGRKVTSSYFHKLGAENYDDHANAVMQAHYDGAAFPPPPEKPYWWPVPRRNDPMAEAFRSFDQFQRICWHWAEINREILDSLAALPAERTLFARLEDLTRSPSHVRELLRFLGLEYQDSDFAVFARPHNVNRPEDRLLTPLQRARFEATAGPMMARLGYADRAEYAVNY
ncbi:MAG: sulfotransferase [Alphaproteobacteria bacterium]|nr:sulfotransferase [Alphaproteobacteria bacterium]